MHCPTNEDIFNPFRKSSILENITPAIDLQIAYMRPVDLDYRPCGTQYDFVSIELVERLPDRPSNIDLARQRKTIEMKQRLVDVGFVSVDV